LDSLCGIQRVSSLVTSTAVDRVVHHRSGRTGTHGLSGSEGSTTGKRAERDDADNNANNSTSSDGSNGDNGHSVGRTVRTRITAVARAVRRGVSSGIGGRVRWEREGLVDALAVVSAVVRAGLGDKDSGNEAGTHVDASLSGTKNGGAVSILRAHAVSEGSSSAGGEARAPTAVETVGLGEVNAFSAVGSREVAALLHLGDSLVAGSTSEVRSSVSTEGTLAHAIDAGTMAAAVVAVIEAVLGHIRARAASDGVRGERGVGASASTSGLIAVAKAAALVGARDTDTLAIASDEETLRIGSSKAGNKAALVDGISQLGSGELNELIGLIADTTLGVAVPRVGVVTRQRVEVALLAGSTSEATRASSGGNDASLTDITTNTGLVTVVHSELEAVAMGRVELEEIKIPHDLSTIGEDGGLNGVGIDKSNGKGIRASTQVPSSTSSVLVGGRIGSSGDGEVVDVVSGLGGNRLGSLPPESTDLLRRIGLATLLPVTNTAAIVEGNVGPEDSRGHRATAGHCASGVLNAACES